MQHRSLRAGSRSSPQAQEAGGIIAGSRHSNNHKFEVHAAVRKVARSPFLPVNFCRTRNSWQQTILPVLGLIGYFNQPLTIKSPVDRTARVCGLALAVAQSACGSNDRDIGGTGGVLGVRKLERTCARVNSEAFNTVSVLARHKQVFATWVKREVSSIRVSRERVST